MNQYESIVRTHKYFREQEQLGNIVVSDAGIKLVPAKDITVNENLDKDIMRHKIADHLNKFGLYYDRTIKLYSLKK